MINTNAFSSGSLAMRGLTFFLPLFLIGILASSSSAQPQSGSARVPLSQPRLRSYLLLAATSTCILAQQKVPFSTALRSNVSAIFTLIRDLHSGRIEGVQLHSTDGAIQKYLGVQIAATSATLCKADVPVDYLRAIQVVSESFKSRKSP